MECQSGETEIESPETRDGARISVGETVLWFCLKYRHVSVLHCSLQTLHETKVFILPNFCDIFAECGIAAVPCVTHDRGFTMLVLLIVDNPTYHFGQSQIAQH